MKQTKFSAYLDDTDIVTVIVDQLFYHDEGQLSIYHNKELIDFEKHTENLYDGIYKLTLRVSKPVDLKEEWKMTLDESIETEILSGKVVRTKSFIRENDYQGDDLGIEYHQDYTVFKLWAPIAKRVNLLLENLNGHKESFSLDYNQQGVWSLKIDGDLNNHAYIYQVYVNGGWKLVKDPYAIASNANGEMAYVIDVFQTKPMINQYKQAQTPIIYEVSVRDFSSNNEIHFNHPKKYLGMIEENLKTKNNHPIGFDYVKSLGITHIQLMPVYDFTGVNELKPNELYNWGYNPSQYFVPEGSFTDQPNHPYKRIDDLKTLIDTYHQNNLGVIMDVVYNHVDEYQLFPYEILVPGYSFRLDDKDMMTVYSGCGNDLDTSRPMIKKLIIDSLKHWVNLYQMDGFRFDLMGLIDYNTMNDAVNELKKIKNDILIYGEGWKIDNNSQLAHMYNKKVVKDIGFFNDQFRDTLKGSTFNVLDKGFTLGQMDHKKTVDSLLKGKGLVNLEQSINYVECHDNHTYFDKAMTIFNDEPLVKKHQLLATVLTILMPGTPFIHLGQEFYRSKSFVENSYNTGDSVNQVDWNLVDQSWDDIEIIKKIIDIRKQTKSYTVTNIHWYDSGFSMVVGAYEIYFFVKKQAFKIDSQYPIYIASIPVLEKENHYLLDDIGITVLERKSTC